MLPSTAALDAAVAPSEAMAEVDPAQPPASRVSRP